MKSKTTLSILLIAYDRQYLVAQFWGRKTLWRNKSESRNLSREEMADTLSFIMSRRRRTSQYSMTYGSWLIASRIRSMPLSYKVCTISVSYTSHSGTRRCSILSRTNSCNLKISKSVWLASRGWLSLDVLKLELTERQIPVRMEHSCITGYCPLLRDRSWKVNHMASQGP